MNIFWAYPTKISDICANVEVFCNMKARKYKRLRLFSGKYTTTTKSNAMIQIAYTYSRHTEFRVKMQCFLAFQVQFTYQKFITVII